MATELQAASFLKTLENQPEAGDLEKDQFLSQFDIPFAHQDLFWLGIESKAFSATELGSRLFRDEVLGKFNVAIHEIGHAFVGWNLGGIVSEISIVPEGHSLGHTLISFMGGIKERLIHMMAALYGGMIAEEKFGISHEGAGNDLSKVEYFSKILSWFFGGDPSDYKSYSLSLAYACVPSVSEIQHHALDLYIKKRK